MNESEVRNFAKRLVKQVGKVIADNENLFFGEETSKAPTGYAKKVQFLDGEREIDAWVGICPKNEAEAKYILRTMTDLLAECLNDVGQNQYDQLTNCSYDIAVLVEGIQKSFGERFTAYSGLPLELIDDLSIQNYEHARCVGTILFLDTSQRDLVNIRVIPKKEVYFCKDDLRQVRKLLAGAGIGKDRNGVCFLQERQLNSIDETYTMAGYAYSETIKTANAWRIDIVDARKFEVYFGNIKLFRMEKMRVKLVKEEWEECLKKILHIFSIQDDSRIETIRMLLKEINEQEHGAAIIFLNLCEGSVARHRITNLFENNRCYKIEDCLQSKQKAATCAEMDGALVFDVEKNRVSYAGLIVDGRVQNPGDMARGARHNSLATFYDDFCAFCKEENQKEPIAILVFSEDGGCKITCE